MENISYFETFEERELMFRKRVHSLLPRKYSGPAVFWKDMGGIIASIVNIPNSPIAYITCNPKDCLAYSFVDDLLNAAKLLLLKESGESLLEEAIEAFEINPIRGQQVHTLSGGEVVRLALARNYLLAGVSTEAIISSPFTWLSNKHHSLYKLFVDAFLREGKQVFVLAMNGENDEKPHHFELLNTNIESQIIIENLRIKLSEDLSESETQKEWALVEDISIQINSPCLLAGDNGAGKSLIAKALSSAVEYTGKATIKTNGYIGHSRLLFQDVILQTLLRPFCILSESEKGTLWHDVRKVYTNIVEKFVSYFKSRNEPVPYIGKVDSVNKTLLEYKFMLTAIRISRLPAALILDEPDWGLAKNVGIAFVLSVIEVAHEKNVPIIIISHKNWWIKIAKSHLLVTKEIINSRNIKYKFNIQESVKHQKEGQ